MKIVCILGNNSSLIEEVYNQLRLMGHAKYILYTTKNRGIMEKNHVNFHYVTEEELDRLDENKRIVGKFKVGKYTYGLPIPVGDHGVVCMADERIVEMLKQRYGVDVIAIQIDKPDGYFKQLFKNSAENLNTEKEKSSLIDIYIKAERPRNLIVGDIIEKEREPEVKAELNLYGR